MMSPRAQIYPEDRYYAELVDADGKRLAKCGHAHTTEAAALRCARRMMRERREMTKDGR